MPERSDYFLERRSLKKRLNLWRIFGLFSVAVTTLIVLWSGENFSSGEHIARVEILGLILPDKDRNKVLNELAKNINTKALLVVINSPGGSYVGGETLFKSIRSFAQNKPVAVVMEDLATSAAYMAAIGGDRIFASEGSLTGSIGVIVQSADFTDLLSRIGIKPEAIKSSPLKAQPNPLEPLSTEARGALKNLVREVHRIFVELVTERRSLSSKNLSQLFDGRVFSGRQALANGLVDAIGGEEDALTWLIRNFKLAPKLPIKDVTPKSENDLLLNLLKGFFRETSLDQRLRLDGLVSLWHPAL